MEITQESSAQPGVGKHTRRATPLTSPGSEVGLLLREPLSPGTVTPPKGPAAPGIDIPLMGPGDSGTAIPLMGPADRGNMTPLMSARR